MGMDFPEFWKIQAFAFQISGIWLPEASSFAGRASCRSQASKNGRV
jgi:hypothetical protein